VAAVLSVSVATVVRWSQRDRASGSAAPAKVGGHKIGILSGSNRDWLLERTKADFTLRGLVAELAERGVKVDYVQVWRFVHGEGLSFKKKRSSRRTASPQGGPAARAVEDVPGPA
jgi:transposase